MSPRVPVFDFREPHRSNKYPRIQRDRVNQPGPGYYERYTTVETCHGLVQVEQMHWDTNVKPTIFTHFFTVINGYAYTAFIDEARLTDSQIKRYAEHFAKIIKNAYTNDH